MISRELARAIIEAETSKDRFSMGTLLRAVMAASSSPATLSAYQDLSNLLGNKVASHVLQGVIRASFLIELVKTPKIETTKFEVRWADRLGHVRKPPDAVRFVAWTREMLIATLR